ncbi:serine/threonine-protein phosphatase 7-like isoform X1 [Coffea arabica]|uniref:Serine/threonine-protein phosphatase n=1 Tax=Coffea arabica TaxID=13443 RepID=A0A6P6T7U2_COFAR|nr:serine/threonine-protein phosphatase 7-like isoform X1 [Coffea arabica]
MLSNLDHNISSSTVQSRPLEPSPAPALEPRPPTSSDEDFFSSTSIASSSSSEDIQTNHSSPPLPPAAPPPPQIPISWPASGTISREWVNELMNAFEWASRAVPPQEFPSLLPVEVFDRLILSASKILHKEKNCVSIEGEELGRVSKVVVVGDLHGQLHDVLFLLKDAGYPGEDRIFVFNGDYVDRGAWGLETFLLLLAWKVILPHRVFLLRGNHESKYCTSVYGFEKEVSCKYGDKGKHVYCKCLGCFEGLPLASIIAGRVYTAHGGIFRSIPSTPSKRYKGKKNRKVIVDPNSTALSLGSFEELSKARRSVLDPPWEGQNLIPGDVLWSDPSMDPGLSPNKERGIGLLWGPDCTEEFLKKFGLTLIIRSHEGPDAREKRPGLGQMNEGYTIDHVVDSGKLITVFSAPDYPQFQATDERYRNKGAYIVLEPPDFDTPVFHTFDAITPRPVVNPYYDYEDVIDSDEELDMASMVPAT